MHCSSGWPELERSPWTKRSRFNEQNQTGIIQPWSPPLMSLVPDESSCVAMVMQWCWGTWGCCCPAWGAEAAKLPPGTEPSTLPWAATLRAAVQGPLPPLRLTGCRRMPAVSQRCRGGFAGCRALTGSYSDCLPAGWEGRLRDITWGCPLQCDLLDVLLAAPWVRDPNSQQCSQLAPGSKGASAEWRGTGLGSAWGVCQWHWSGIVGTAASYFNPSPSVQSRAVRKFVSITPGMCQILCTWLKVLPCLGHLRACWQPCEPRSEGTHCTSLGISSLLGSAAPLLSCCVPCWQCSQVPPWLYFLLRLEFYGHKVLAVNRAWISRIEMFQLLWLIFTLTYFSSYRLKSIKVQHVQAGRDPRAGGSSGLFWHV